MHREIQKDKDYTFTWKFYDRNTQIVPTLATINIYNNAGSSIVSAASGSIDAEGTITYTFLAAANDSDDVNFKIVLDYTYSTVIRIVEIFDVVIYPIVNLVRDEDLIKYISELNRNLMSYSGKTSAAGSTTTFIDTSLTIDEDQWKGGKGEIFISTIPHEFKTSSYAKATGTITFTPAYSSAIPTGTPYTIRDSYQDIIDMAYEDHVHRDVRNKVGVSAGYIDSNVLKNLTVFKSLQIICSGEVETFEDKWDLRAKEYKQEYKDELSKLQEPFDSDLDGNISDTEDRERPFTGTMDIVR